MALEYDSSKWQQRVNDMYAAKEARDKAPKPEFILVPDGQAFRSLQSRSVITQMIREQIEQAPGVNRCNEQGRYRLQIEKGELFTWDEVEAIVIPIMEQSK